MKSAIFAAPCLRTDCVPTSKIVSAGSDTHMISAANCTCGNCTPLERKMRSRILLFLLTIAFMALPLGAQEFSSGEGLQDSAANDREIKRIAEKPIPPIAELVVEDIKQADNAIEFLKRFASQSLRPDAKADQIKAKLQQLISTITTETKRKPCDKKVVLKAVESLRQELGHWDEGSRIEAAGLAPQDTYNMTESVRLLADIGSSRNPVCVVEVLPDEETINRSVDELSKSIEQRETAFENQVPLARKLQAAWESKKTELIQAGVDQQKQTADIFVQKLPWIVLVFCLFGLSVIAVIWIFSESVQMEWVASGQVIQFASVMVLLIVVASLGILKILDKEGIGTLLGAIAGYVLSQGVGRAAARAATSGQGAPGAGAPGAGAPGAGAPGAGAPG